MTSPRLTRAQWGAIPVPAGRPTRVDRTEGTAVHWVGPSLWGRTGHADRHAQCAGKLRAIQRQHMAGEWYDVAYNEGVCPHGYRFELRGHHVQTGANGSSTGNRSHYAILALVGVGDDVPAVMVAALVDAFADYRANAGAGPDTTTHTAILKAHTGKTTQCPGTDLIRLEAAGTFTRAPAAPSRAKPRRPAPAVPRYPGPTRPSRTYSPATRAFQARLKARGWRIDVDGYHGPQTSSVLRSFQRNKRLKAVDGLGGPETWTALWRLPITD